MAHSRVLLDQQGDPARHAVIHGDLRRQLASMIKMYDNAVTKHVLRSHAEIRALFGDFELVEPGMTWTAAWHPEETAPGSTVIEFGSPNESAMYAGVGRKPRVITEHKRPIMCRYVLKSAANDEAVEECHEYVRAT